MGRRFAFDVQAAIPAAWKVLWAANLKRRAEGGHYRPSQTYYLTAADVENQVRAFADATSRGEPWENAPIAYGRPISRVRFSGDLQRTVRDWLLGEVRRGRLASHNFGRSHISGMRFRPAGEPISEAEQTTTKNREARKGRPKPCHFSKSGYGGRPLCTSKRVRAIWSRSNAWTTKDKERVTCARCLKLLAAMETGLGRETQ